ncbi:MAG: hypothetical protein GWP05_03865 [Anaerolineaceae bacterium]|nr:hypothetical protein [Anaerolineaceae bacterium]
MQVLNFVPDNYAQKKLARQATLLSALLAAAVLVALVVVVVVMGMAEDFVEESRRDIASQESSATADVAKWEQLKNDRRALLRRASRPSRLLTALPRSLVLAEVVRVLPPRTTLTRFSLDKKTIRVIEGKKSEQQSVRSRRRLVRKNSPKLFREYSETSLQVIGLAPTDVEAAQLIAALARSPYFDNVELSYSEDMKHNDHVLRRFEILFRLRDQADRLASSTGAQEDRL